MINLKENANAPFIALILVILVFTPVYLIVSQPAEQLARLKPDNFLLGVEYRINGLWVPQFRGEIDPINGSAFSLSWYRFSETEPIQVKTFHNPDANYYTVNLETFYAFNGSRTQGVFIVSWYSGSRYIGRSVDRGTLVIRDQEGNARDFIDIQRVRKYEYQAGLYG